MELASKLSDFTLGLNFVYAVYLSCEKPEGGLLWYLIFRFDAWIFKKSYKDVEICVDLLVGRYFLTLDIIYNINLE